MEFNAAVTQSGQPGLTWSLWEIRPSEVMFSFIPVNTPVCVSDPHSLTKHCAARQGPEVTQARSKRAIH